MQVDFRFSVDQRVVTPFGDEGIVKMAAVDDGGKEYFVQTKITERWFPEKNLTEAQQGGKA